VQAPYKSEEIPVVADAKTGENPPDFAWLTARVNSCSPTNSGLFGGGVAEGAEDIVEGDNAFKLAQIGAVHDGNDGPISDPAKDFLEGFVGKNQRQRPFEIQIGGDERRVLVGLSRCGGMVRLEV
jgi:hypothetical protein